MATEEKTVLLKIDLDTSSLVKNSKEAEKELEKLKAQQLELKNSTGTNTVEYAKVQEQIRQYTRQLKDNASALVINEQLSGKTELTNVELAKSQKAIAVAYNNLTDEQRENTAEGQKITAQYKAINDALNKNALSVNDGRRNVGLYKQAIIDANKEISGLKKEVTAIGFAYGKTNKELEDTNNEMQALAKNGATDTQAYKILEKQAEELNQTLSIQKNVLDGATQELDQQEKQLEATKEEARKIGFVYGENAESLIELKKAIREATDEAIQMENQFGKESQQYVDSINKVGQLKDRLKDLKETTTQLSGGSGVEKFGNTLGGLKDDLLNLDFEGVSEKAKTLQTISSKMTFAETISGIKNLGSSLVTLGKTLLTNPLFLLAAVVVGVVAALIHFSDETETAEAEQAKFNTTIEKTNTLLANQTSRLVSSANQRVKLAELEGKSIEEIAELQRKAFDIEAKQREKQMIVSKRIIDELYEKEKLNRQRGLDDIAKENIERRKQEYETLNDLKNAKFQHGLDVEIFEKETAKAIKERDKQNALDRKKILDDRNLTEIQQAKELAEHLLDLTLQGNEISNETERKLVDEKYKFLETMALGNAERLIEIQEEKNKELAELDQKEKADEIARLKQKHDSDIKAENITAEEIKLIDANLKKEIEQLEVDFNARSKDREAQLFQDKKALEEESKADKITRLEAEQIEAENILKRANATELEILQTNAKNEIAIETEKNKQIQENKNISDAEKFKSEQELQSKIIDLNKSTAEKEAQIQKEKNDKFLKGTSFALNQAQALSQAYFDIVQSNIQRELDTNQQATATKIEQLDKQLSQGLISQEEYNKQTAKLQKDLAKQESELKREAWEKNKQAQLAQAIIGGATAVVEALASSPPPASYILAGVTAGLTAVQIALIENQKPPKFAKGGVFGGQPHSSGGTKGVFSDGTQIEVEKDESFFILNKRATPLISKLSSINVATGGVPLMAGGGVVTVNDSVQRVNAEISTRSLILDVISNLPPSIVLVEDINTGQNNLVKVQNSGDI